MKKIFKSNRKKKNRGDIAVFSIIVFGTLVVTFYGMQTISSNLSSVQNNARLALDSSLFYLSTLGETSVIIKETGTEDGNEYQTVCTMKEDELVVQTLNYVCPLLIEKQSGFNNSWTVWMCFRNSNNYKSPSYYKFFTSGTHNSNSSYDGHKWNYFWMVSSDSRTRNNQLKKMDGIKLSSIENQPKCPDVPDFDNSSNTMRKYEEKYGLTYNATSNNEVQIYDTVSLFLDVRVPTYNISDYDHYFNEANPYWTWSESALGANRGRMLLHGVAQCRGSEKKTGF